MDTFEFLVASDIDYDKLIVEIYFEGRFVALLNQDRGPDNVTIEFPSPDQSDSAIVRAVPLDGFMEAISRARDLLLGKAK